MDDATAKSKLARMVAAADEPVIADSDLAALVADHKYTAASGAIVYDLQAAAVEGWRMKAASAASRVTFSSDGQQISRSHFYDHCERMIEHHLAAANFSLPTGPGA